MYKNHHSLDDNLHQSQLCLASIGPAARWTALGVAGSAQQLGLEKILSVREAIPVARNIKNFHWKLGMKTPKDYEGLGSCWH